MIYLNELACRLYSKCEWEVTNVYTSERSTYAVGETSLMGTFCFLCDGLIYNVYTFWDTQCSSTDCLLMLRCQLYMFRTVTVHPQELLFRCCMCRLWYVLICPAGTTFEEEQFFLKRCTSGTYQIVRFLQHTIVCTYSIKKEAPEDGPLRSETCRADTWASINNQCCYIVYLGTYMYCKKLYTDLPMSSLIYNL